MSQLRQTLENEDSLDKFDRMVFESIVEKVIVGGYDADGNPAPYKLAFILKCDETLKVRNAKADYKANRKGKKGVMMGRSRQDILNKKETGKICLSYGNELDEMCSVEDDDTCGDCMFDV